MEPKDRIIVALDVNDPAKAISLVRSLTPYVGCFKIGLEFINSMIANITTLPTIEAYANFKQIRELFSLLDGNIFWDGKFDDTPNTVAGATKETAKMRVKMFNVHASAGIKSMEAAVANKGNSLVLAVTVLTTIGDDESELIFGAKSIKKVIEFATDAEKAGCDGIVCSPLELKRISSLLPNLIKVVPGVRPKWAQANDQKRIMTPYDAIRAGADYLVVGRGITNPPAEIGSPVDAAKKIAEEIASAL